MKRLAQNEIKILVTKGYATDITTAHDHNAVPERYEKIAYSVGKYGCNGLLLRGVSGTLYAITKRTTAIFMFM